MSFLKRILGWLIDLVVGYIIDHPGHLILAVPVLVRMFGTTVRSGYRGVLFTFGRARKVLEPGFHLLLPVVYHVRKTPVRSITLDLPKQHVTTADGLVYEVQANLVYRISDPIASMVQIDNVRKGIEAVLPTIVQELLRERTRDGMVTRAGLDEAFAAGAEGKLRRWGVTVEQAGFKSIAPTRPTLRLTQLQQLAAERARALERYVAAGLSPAVAVALLGSEKRCVGHAAHRYRGGRFRRQGGAANAPCVRSDRLQAVEAPTR